MKKTADDESRDRRRMRDPSGTALAADDATERSYRALAFQAPALTVGRPIGASGRQVANLEKGRFVLKGERFFRPRVIVQESTGEGGAVPKEVGPV